MAMRGRRLSTSWCNDNVPATTATWRSRPIRAAAAGRAGVPVPELVGFVGRRRHRRSDLDHSSCARRDDRSQDPARRRRTAAGPAAAVGRAWAGAGWRASDRPGGPSRWSSADPLQVLRERLDEIGQPHPTFELAFRWLVRPPSAERRCEPVVHGDFRLGNVIVDADGPGGRDRLGARAPRRSDGGSRLDVRAGVAVRFAATGGRCRDSRAAAGCLRRAVGRRRRPGDRSGGGRCRGSCDGGSSA